MTQVVVDAVEGGLRVDDGAGKLVRIVALGQVKLGRRRLGDILKVRLHEVLPLVNLLLHLHEFYGVVAERGRRLSSFDKQEIELVAFFEESRGMAELPHVVVAFVAADLVIDLVETVHM